MRIPFALFFFLLLPTTFTFAQNRLEEKIKANYRAEIAASENISTDTLSAFEAELMLYEEVVFKGMIISTFNAYFEEGKPTFLNVEKLYPNNPVVLVIFEKEIAQFLPAEEYRGREVLIKGKIKLHKYEFGWKSSIILKTPDQITILN